MPVRRGSQRVTKNQVVTLLDRQAGVSADDLVCNAEANAFLLCMSSRIAAVGSYDGHGCEAEDLAVRRCCMRMEQHAVHKLKKDLKRSLIFQMLRLANFKKAIK